MRIAVTYNGLCDNIIEADSLETIVPMFPGADLIDASSTTIGIGWKWANGAWAPLPPPPPDTSHVDAERDRRIAAGFVFGGVEYQSRPDDRENIAGAAVAALGAMMTGAQPGDLRWHGGDSDFLWIATDNTTHAMDAQTVFAFGQAAMAHKQAMIFAARAIKDADPIPADYTNDAYWP
jgi:hypothetical protein